MEFKQENCQFSSVPQSCPTLCDPMNCSTPGLPVHHQLLEFIQTQDHRVSDAIQPSHPLLSLLLLPPILPSIRVFSNESTLCMRQPMYWRFSFSISPFNEHSGLISFGMNWMDLLAVQGTLKSLLQHHSPKASILRIQITGWLITPAGYQIEEPCEHLNVILITMFLQFCEDSICLFVNWSS